MRVDAELHAQGLAEFTDDLPLPVGTLAVFPVVASIAHGLITKIDSSAALALPGVLAVYTAHDINGINQIGNNALDEVLLVETEVMYQGQAIALVVAETATLARRAAAAVRVEYALLPAIFDVRTADQAGQHIVPKRTFFSGNVAAAWAECALVLTGTVQTGAQEHMYLETQSAFAIPQEQQCLRVVSATQSPGFVQRMIAKVLALPMHAIEVEVLRLGGGFGGKEEQATAFAVMVALVAHRLQRPAKLTLRRDEDCRFTGKRHPYTADFRIGLDAAGKIKAYQVDFLQNAGAIADLSPAILERTLFHATNAYAIPHVQISAASCRTNLPPNTAFRGFGAPQAMFVLESAIAQAAAAMQMEVSSLQQLNLLSSDDWFYYGMQAEAALAKQCWRELHSRYAIAARREAIAAFNAQHVLHKKGLALMPICFGIAFTATFLNQADALVHVYSDGSVSVSCGAVEMGQGVKQKIAHIVADTLGIEEQRVRVESTNTLRIANMSPTAASTGVDLNGQAARLACLQIRQSILHLAAGLLTAANVNELSLQQERLYQQAQPTALTWPELVTQAYLARMALSAEAHYATPELYFDRQQERGHPFAYHVYGCAAVEVTLDCLRGQYTVDRVSIVHDIGQPLDVAVDRGQVEGAVVQGIGWMTLEEVVYDNSGRLMTDSFTHYKIPDIHAAPEIELYFLPGTGNKAGVLQAKAVGEPPFMYGIAAYFALLQAIKAFNPAAPINYDAPLTPEKVLLALYQTDDSH